MTKSNASTRSYHATGRWVRSSRCIPNKNCVELRIRHDTVAVRDSKNPAGAHLAFARADWGAFLTAVE